MVMRVITLAAITACISLLISGCGPRNASLSQSILGEWKIIETYNADEFEGTDDLYQSGIIYKFHTNHQYDIFLTAKEKISGVWDAEKSSTNVGLNAQSQKMNVKVSIEDAGMIWALEDSTSSESPIAKITFVKN